MEEDIEEDIKELEKVVALREKMCKGKIEFDTCIVGTRHVKELISRNKELEEENNNYKKYAVMMKSDGIILNGVTFDIKNYIPKSKVKEKIEEIDKEYDERNSKEEDFNYNYGEEYAFAIDKLKELLEE